MGIFDTVRAKLKKARAGDEAAAVRAPAPGARLRRVRRKGQDRGQAQPPSAFSGRNIFYYFMFTLLFLALYLTYLLMQPFWHTIILACIFSGLCHPLYIYIRKKTGWRDYLASALTLAAMVLLICVPLTMFLTQLIPQATVSIKELAQWLGSNHLDAWVNERFMPFLNWVNDEVITFVDIDVADIRASLMGFSRTAGQRLVGWGTGLVFDSINIFVNFILMLLIMFFLLKDGESMVNTLRALSPLRTEQEDNIIQSLRRMTNAVLIGGFSVAALQGFVGGIGLAIVGIKPLFWGTVMAAAALVPILGTGLVWVPAVCYLALSGHTREALFLLVWCGVLVTTIDSLLRPIIMRGSSKVSLLFLFMAVFGGIQAFGPVGIIYGPLILSFVLAMIDIYSKEFVHLNEKDSRPPPSAERRRPRLKPAQRVFPVKRRK